MTAMLALIALAALPTPVYAAGRYGLNCFDKPYGAGNPYSPQTIYVVPQD